MIKNRKAISSGGIVALVNLVLMVALSLWILSPALVKVSAPSGKAHVTATSAYVTGTILRVTLKNDGEVRLRLLYITARDTNIEGSATPGTSIEPGTSKEVDVGLSKGSIPSGATVTLTLTIRTDKGEFTQQLSVRG